MTTSTSYPMIDKIKAAAAVLNEQFDETILHKNEGWSNRFDASIYFKREDLNVVRSYKIRGAYNRMSCIKNKDITVVCASAGNHAQGVAYAAKLLGLKARIYMPVVTPNQKCERVKLFGGKAVKIVLHGDTFDEAYDLATAYARTNRLEFIHPFDDHDVIAGQGTVGLEILKQFNKNIDYIFLPVGGGGLAAGVSTYLKRYAPRIKIIGVEPSGAPAMKYSLAKGNRICLDQIDTFVDGASVKQVGRRNFELCKQYLDEVVTVDEGEVCATILSLYNEEAIVAEPAGALSIAAMRQFANEIKGKTVVCILSGGNNDVMRMEEIKERSLLYEGLKHYFIVQFPQRTGALKEFLISLGPQDDITHFEYTKKTNRETGAALVGIELKRADDYQELLNRMTRNQVKFQTINNNPVLFDMLV